MRRSLDHVLQSQRRMKGQEALPLGLNEKMNWEKTFKKTSFTLALDPHAIIELDYDQLVNAVEEGRINKSLTQCLQNLSMAVERRLIFHC